MPSLTNLVSIWLGIILVGTLIFPQHWKDKADLLSKLSESPTNAMTEIVSNVFKGAGIYVASLFVGTIVGAALTGQLTNFFVGQNYSILFLIPALFAFAVLSYFVIPTNQIFNYDLPWEIKFIYSAFMGTLVMLTIVSFIRGGD